MTESVMMLFVKHVGSPVMCFFNAMANTKESRWNTWELTTDLPL